MKWQSALSREPDTAEALAQVSHDLDDIEADLLIAFITPHHAEAFDALPKALAVAWPDATIVGCTAAGVVGAETEVEEGPCLAVVAASLPDVVLRVFHLDGEGTHEPLEPAEVVERVGIDPLARPCFVLLADPFTCNTENLLRILDAAYAGLPKIGGLASGARVRGEHALFVHGRTVREGAVGLALYGDIELHTVVAQGARPVGPVLRVSGVEDGLVTELDDLPALEVLQGVFEQLEGSARVLFRRSPLMGVAMDATATRVGRGDFLVRNVVGYDEDSGSIAIAHPVVVGDLIQLHVRDADTSTEDLRDLLMQASRTSDGFSGALMFSCLGRGESFFRESNHDTKALQTHVGPISVGGFFCNGELGPVRGRTFLHGYTSSVGLFRRPAWN